MSSTVADLLVERLIGWGVDTIFGFPGDGINGIFEALRTRQEQIRFIQVRHEEAAAFAACGYAKYTGRLGVCLATSGPGRHSSAQRAVRREVRRPAGARHHRTHLSRSDRHALPAGRRSRQAVHGRRRIQSARDGAGARRTTWSTKRSRPRWRGAPSRTSRSPRTSRTGPVSDEHRSGGNIAHHSADLFAAAHPVPPHEIARSGPPT